MLTESTLLCILVVHPKLGIGQVCCDHGHGGAWGWQIVTCIFLPPTDPYPPTFGLLGDASINLVLDGAFFPAFSEGAP